MTLVSDISLIKWVIAIITLALCMGALTILAKKFGPQGRSMSAGRRLQLLEIMHLDPRHKVCLFRHDDMEKIVVIGPQGVTPLAADQKEVPPQPKAKPTTPKTPSKQKRIKK